MIVDPQNFVFSVSDINSYMKTLVSNDENLRFLMVKGEISNFKYGSNGHMYFSLKDNRSMISVTIFKDYAKRIAFVPKDGDLVTVYASLEVYEARGTYQLIARMMEKKGQGDLLLELEERKKKLEAEGIFSKPKREIPAFPKAIGIISALNSAALKDILTNIKKRYPLIDIYVFPSQVQGESAPKELIKAFNKAMTYPLDTLIIGRGGGSSEDLSAFNDEELVRTLYTSKIPLIAAVGHEIDFTLTDYVADKRVSTPTGAAVLATPDLNEIRIDIDNMFTLMKQNIKNKVKKMREDILREESDIKRNLKDKVKLMRLRLESLKKELTALNPHEVLSRGYSLTYTSDGHIVKSINDVKPNDIIVTELRDGKVISEVKENN